MKKIFGFLILLLSFVYVSTQSASAAELGNTESEVSDLFINFMDNAYDNLDGLTVLNSDGVDITKEFIKNATKYYDVKDYKSIQDMIGNENLSISTTKREVIPSQLLGTRAVALGTIRGDNVSKIFYHNEYDKSKGKYKKEWETQVSGSFSYDDQTFQITSVGTPKISIFAHGFGAGWSPYLAEVSTSSSKSGMTATFKASYNMRASTSIPLLDYPLIRDWDWGNYTDSFTAGPSVLQ